MYFIPSIMIDSGGGEACGEWCSKGEPRLRAGMNPFGVPIFCCMCPEGELVTLVVGCCG
jgi:hypothetical protein